MRLAGCSAACCSDPDSRQTSLRTGKDIAQKRLKNTCKISGGGQKSPPYCPCLCERLGRTTTASPASSLDLSKTKCTNGLEPYKCTGEMSHSTLLAYSLHVILLCLLSTYYLFILIFTRHLCVNERWRYLKRRSRSRSAPTRRRRRS